MSARHVIVLSFLAAAGLLSWGFAFYVVRRAEKIRAVGRKEESPRASIHFKVEKKHVEETTPPEERRSGDRMQFRRETGLVRSRSKNEKKRERRLAAEQGA
jgi:hypothetical protein